MAIIILLCFLLQLLSSSFHFSVAQTQATNITLGSILSAGNTSASWLSPSGDFTCWFYPVLGDRFLVGIWFHKIPEKTLVWSANRDTPVREGSTLELTRSSCLVIKDPQGNGDFHIYNKTGANSASMQDDGNFVLRNSGSVVIWHSFDSPTNTVLPGQVLNMNQELFSNDNGTYNYSTGKYKLKMQDDGNLVMSAARYAETGYWWTAEANELGPNRSFIFNERSALMYIVINKTYITYNVTGSIHPPKPIGDYYHRAMIDDKGNFKQYAYLKVNGTWPEVWRAVNDPCNPKALCGEYGYCVSDDKQEPSCRCIDGYTVRFEPPVERMLRKNCWRPCTKP